MVEEKKITDYVKYIVAHPFEDVYVASTKFFSTATLINQEKKLVVPELLQLTPAKRTLVINIVKNKTNYDIAPASDNFGKFLMIKEVGTVLNDIGPEIVKKIKWLIK